MADLYTPTGNDTQDAMEVWQRYRYMRDHGHTDFVRAADERMRFFRGDQWATDVLSALADAGRPALTINMIKRTVKAVLSEQIHTRAEISILPINNGNDGVANALQAVFKHIQRTNQLDWAMTELFLSGLVTARGYLDMRLDYDDNMLGSIRVKKLNPKNVMVDPDATEYDPDDWCDVITTKWLSTNEIEATYGKEYADYLRIKNGALIEYGADALVQYRDRISDWNSSPTDPSYGLGERAGKFVRVVERQAWEMVRRDYLIDMQTGDMRVLPEEWDRNRTALFLQRNPHITVVKRPGKRIRWTHVADNILLHKSWSPYEHYTIVPYFPLFMDGHPMGLVEDLIGPQELLNKSSSQELHVINTTANSGWIVKNGTLVNMDAQELENEGSKTGLVIEVSDDIEASIKKIAPNNYPTGLDRISFKADQWIKDISNVNDSMLGTDREDVAAKAAKQKQQAGVATFAVEFDNLARTNWLLARNAIDIVQRYYTEERMIPIVIDELTGEADNMMVNSPDAVTGEILNDLTLGQYHITVGMQPSKDLMEDAEFDQALDLREAGVAIDDEVLIKNSRLRDRGQIIKNLQASKASPQAQQMQQLQMQNLQLNNDKLAAEVQRLRADAANKDAKAQSETDKNDRAEAELQMDLHQRIHDAGVADAGTAQAQAAGQLDLEQQRQQMAQQAMAHAQQGRQADERHAQALQHNAQRHAQEQRHKEGKARLDLLLAQERAEQQQALAQQNANSVE